MPTEILMPALSPTMEEGKLAKWLVKEGDTVGPGDIIAEIETDKATMEVEAVDEGTVGKILIEAGTEGVAVNKTIALLLEEGEDESALEGFEPEGAVSSTPSQESSPPDEERKSDSTSPPRGEVAGQSPAGEGARQEGAQGAPGEAAQKDSFPPKVRPNEASSPLGKQATKESVPAPSANGQGGRIFASPLARRLARQGNIDLSALQGSGPHGRIVKADVERAAEDGVAAAPQAGTPGQQIATRGPAPGGQPEPGGPSDAQVMALYEKGSYEVVPHDSMRTVIAQRLTQAVRTIPHFYLSVDCRIDGLLAARERVNAMAPKDGPRAFKVSVNDMIIKAMAMALQKVPEANATWTSDGLLRHRSSDVAIAVAVEGGLFTPVLRHAEVKSLSEISNEMKDLAHRARSKRLAPHEYQGGTTAISNLGMYGIKQFDAVINPPHASILAVGKGEKRPIIDGDEIKIATMMSCTLAVDHRVIDGALGANLLAAFQMFIEEPVTMLV